MNEDRTTIKMIYDNLAFPNEQLTMDLSFGNIIIEGTLGGIVPDMTITAEKAVFGPSDQLILELHLNDERFSPHLIEVEFVNKNDTEWSKYVTFRWDDQTGSYKPDWDPGAYDMKNGQYTVKRFSFYDQNGYFDFNNSLYNNYGVQFESDETIFIVEGTLAGWILDFTVEALPKEATTGETVAVKVQILSDELELNSIALQFNKEDMSSGWYETEKISVTEFIFHMPVEDYLKSQKYELQMIYLNGNDYYTSVYDNIENPEWNSRDLSGGDFEILGTPGDNEKPELTDVIMPSTIYVNSNVIVKVLAQDDLAGFESGHIQWALNGEFYQDSILYEKDGMLLGDLHTPGEKGSTLSILRVVLTDKASNHAFYYYPELTDGNAGEVPLPELVHSFILDELLYTDEINIYQSMDTYSSDEYIDIRFNLPLDDDVVSLYPVYESPEGHEYVYYAYRNRGNTFSMGTFVYYGMTPGTYPLAIDSISITNNPNKSSYIVGEEIDLTGLEVTGSYNDGTTRIETISMDNISGFDSSNPATQQVVTVTVDGKTATFTVDIIAIMLESIEITKQPNKMSYFVGEKLDLTGLEVTGTYNNGEKRLETITMDNITGFNSSNAEAGQVVTVTVDSKTATFTVDIIAIILESIEITNQPNKLSYFVGEKLDLTGLEVTGTYNNGETRVETITEENITGFNSTNAEVDQVELNVIGLEVTGIYNNGEKRMEIVTVENTTGFDSSNAEAGQVVTVTIDGKTATFTVDIIAIVLESVEITKMPEKLSYFVGEELDLTGLEVTGTYNNGEKKVETITEENITGFGSSNAEAGQVVMVTVDGKTATFSVDIIAIVLESIEITKQPNKLSYFVGEELDLTGLEVTGTYNNGEKRMETVTAENITGFDSSQAETGQLITVTVDGKTAVFAIDIVENYVMIDAESG